MKFGKLLQESTQGMPEMGSVFLRYKQLKQQLKKIQREQSKLDRFEGCHISSECSASAAAIEREFLKMLNEDVNHFNQFYIDKEEESVIKLQAVKDQIANIKLDTELRALKASLVELHGEMVLVLHWSLLNYAAVMKILKKHDKCTGRELKRPFQPIVLQQPFSSTTIISQLVKEAEELLQQLVAAPAPSDLKRCRSADLDPQSSNNVAALEQLHLQETEEQEQEASSSREARSVARNERSCNEQACSSSQQELPMILRRTQVALHMWLHMSRTASTPSTVLPPEMVTQMQPPELQQRKRVTWQIGGVDEKGVTFHSSKRPRIVSPQEVS